MRASTSLVTVLLTATALGCGETATPITWTPALDGEWVSSGLYGLYVKPRYMPGSELGGELPLTPVAFEVTGSTWRLTSTSGTNPWCDPGCAWTVAGSLTYSNPCGTNIEDTQCILDVTFVRETQSHVLLAILSRTTRIDAPMRYLFLTAFDTAGIGHVLALFGVPLPDFTVNGEWCCAERDVVGLRLELEARE